MDQVVGRRLGEAIVIAALSLGTASAQPASAGRPSFPTVAGPEAQQAFLSGLAWLHSFEYEQAIASFRAAQASEPGFAMAYWGEAICYQQFLWGNEDPAMARQVLGRLGPTPAARAARAASPREAAWLASLDVLFGPGDRADRLARYAAAMGALASADPADAEAAVFEGLALMATAARGMAGAHHGGSMEAPQLAGSPIQDRAARIFKDVLQRDPRHPGALHYLIHVYDDPVHASEALEPARRYAEVAPESSHARHMPAHVFLQLGRWHEAAASDEAAFAASEAMVARQALPATMRDYHALSWLVYEYLQLGRFADARQALDQLAAVADESRLPALLSLRATLRARVVAEAGAWREMPGPGYVNYDELFAVGLGAIARGEAGLAELARERLTEMSMAERYRERKPLLDIMARVLSARLRHSAGDPDGALAALGEAADLEATLPVSIGPPPLIKPALEIYGELLLERQRAREADAQFARSLDRARNRSASLLGRARAAVMLGETERAQTYYRQFLDNWKAADADRAESREAREFLAAPTATPSSRIGVWPLVATSGLVLAGVAFLWVKQSRRAAAPVRPRRHRARRHPGS